MMKDEKQKIILELKTSVNELQEVYQEIINALKSGTDLGQKELEGFQRLAKEIAECLESFKTSKIT